MIYTTAFEAATATSIQMDMLLGLLVDDAPQLTGWHQIIKCKDLQDFRTFDLIDGEDLGRSYKDRQFARHVSMKARVHWARHDKWIMARVHAETGMHVSVFRNERLYFSALSKVTGYMRDVLLSMRSLHVALVKMHKLQEINT